MAELLLPLLSSAPQNDLQRLNSIAYPAGLSGNFAGAIDAAGQAPLRATGIEVLQLNIGRICNQTCSHCHVDAGPTRTEIMDRATAELCMRVLGASAIPTLDLTGGAPELCPSFEYIVQECQRLGRRILNRCNLTVLTLPRHEHLAQFFAEHGVEVISSLPHYRELATDRQRGAGVYAKSIEGLRKLNRVGYGMPDSGLELVLVTNPDGASLPCSAASPEEEWKQALEHDHGLHFNRLIRITNMPVRRYLDWLQASGNLEGYMQRLIEAFNPAAALGVMCRYTLNVDWQGYLYDCDFNQMLELGLQPGLPAHLRDFDLEQLAQRLIKTNAHCFGCTAAAGSSCAGATA